MPLPMVHFAVAREILRALGRSDDPDFYLGAITPDAVHTRANYIPKHKANSHFADIWDRRFDPDIWRANALAARENRPRSAFSEGYIAHVLTDIAWNNATANDYHAAYDSDPAPKVELSKAYYNDMDVIDLLLYAENPLFQRMMIEITRVKARGFGDLVTADECAAWRAREVKWLADKKISDYQPLYYADKSQITAFISDSAREIANAIR